MTKGSYLGQIILTNKNKKGSSMIGIYMETYVFTNKLKIRRRFSYDRKQNY
jgi:hypothetical protein